MTGVCKQLMDALKERETVEVSFVLRLELRHDGDPTDEESYFVIATIPERSSTLITDEAKDELESFVCTEYDVDSINEIPEDEAPAIIASVKADRDGLAITPRKW